MVVCLLAGAVGVASALERAEALLALGAGQSSLILLMDILQVLRRLGVLLASLDRTLDLQEILQLLKDCSRALFVQGSRR